MCASNLGLLFCIAKAHFFFVIKLSLYKDLLL